jgi:hypothetical protein
MQSTGLRTGNPLIRTAKSCTSSERAQRLGLFRSLLCSRISLIFLSDVPLSPKVKTSKQRQEASIWFAFLPDTSSVISANHHTLRSESRYKHNSVPASVLRRLRLSQVFITFVLFDPRANRSPSPMGHLSQSVATISQSQSSHTSELAHLFHAFHSYRVQPRREEAGRRVEY